MVALAIVMAVAVVGCKKTDGTGTEGAATTTAPAGTAQ
jgi:hypothetical protein